jgi:hypothetical protein
MCISHYLPLGNSAFGVRKWSMVHEIYYLLIPCLKSDTVIVMSFVSIMICRLICCTTNICIFTNVQFTKNMSIKHHITLWCSPQMSFISWWWCVWPFRPPYPRSSERTIREYWKRFLKYNTIQDGAPRANIINWFPQLGHMMLPLMIHVLWQQLPK